MVSVIIPTYNRFDLLNRAIDSVMKQTFKDFEIIVVDDCSDDIRYNELYSDTRIKYIKLPSRMVNPAKVRNVGLKSSKYEWVAFLDDDDYWFEEKLEKQIELTNNNSFICAEALNCGNIYTTYIHGWIWKIHNINDTNIFDYELLQKHNYIITSSVMIKKNLLVEIDFFPEDDKYYRHEDYETWLRVLKNGNTCHFIRTPLIDLNSNSVKNH